MIKQTMFAVLFVAVAALAVPDISSAQGRGMGRGGGMGYGPVASSCSREIAKYCHRYRHGGGEVRACLNRNRARLSRRCRQTLNNTGYGRRGGRGQGYGRGRNWR
jgi:hypothetical protein